MLAWWAYFTHPARISALVLARKALHRSLHFCAFPCFPLFLPAHYSVCEKKLIVTAHL